jgi:hypothetical protein
MNLLKRLSFSLILVVLWFPLSGCQQKVPKDALTLSPESLADRQMQTRLFDTKDEKALLTASAQVLQDLGYTIVESEVPCGVIVCTRERDVTDPGEVAGKIIVGALLGVYMPWDTNQKVQASLVTKPVDEKRTAVRITFQHMVWNTQKQMTKCEQINEPEIYQEFFSKLSKSVFLTAHEL